MRQKNIHSLGHRITKWPKEKYTALVDKITHRTEREAADREIMRMSGVVEGLEKRLFLTEEQLEEAEKLAPELKRSRAEVETQRRRAEEYNTEVITASSQLYAAGLSRNPGKKTYLFVDTSGKVLYQSPKAERLLGQQASLGDFVYGDAQGQSHHATTDDARMDQIVSDVLNSNYNPESTQKSGILLVTKDGNPEYKLEIINEKINNERGAHMGTMITVIRHGRRIKTKHMGSTTIFQTGAARVIGTKGRVEA